MSPTEQANETARLLAAWASGEPLAQNTSDGWIAYTSTEMPRIHNPQNWMIRRHPRTFWSIPHSNGVEWVSTTDAATAKHWHEDGHSVIVSVELIPQ